jgi:hypothetical protein
MMAGHLIILGATGMGAAVSFIPRPVVVGFWLGSRCSSRHSDRDFFVGWPVPRLLAEDGGSPSTRGRCRRRQRRWLSRW